MTKRIDLTGKKFGRLLVLGLSHSHDGNLYWSCRCECGKQSVVAALSLKSGRTKSCGCLFIESIKGSNNPAWKGGVTPEINKIRSSTKYRDWRNSIFTRDSFTCQKCKKVGGNLNAHHKQSFAGNPKLRTELKNGITLCDKCHKTFHKKYGYRNNNYQQVTAFLK